MTDEEQEAAKPSPKELLKNYGTGDKTPSVPTMTRRTLLKWIGIGGAAVVSGIPDQRPSRQIVQEKDKSPKEPEPTMADVEQLISENNLKEAFIANLRRYLAQDKNREIWQELSSAETELLKIKRGPQIVRRPGSVVRTDTIDTGMEQIIFNLLKPDAPQGDRELIRMQFIFNPATNQIKRENLTFLIGEDNKITNNPTLELQSISAQETYDRLSQVLAHCPETGFWHQPFDDDNPDPIRALEASSSGQASGSRDWSIRNDFNTSGLFELEGVNPKDEDNLY